MAINDSKKYIRVAFIGVNPSEKVMLKGYFGFLLRNDVEFQWLAGNDENIDLYLINEQFKGSQALMRISKANPHPHAILYVSHEEDDGQGYVRNNSIRLPLHNLNELKDWLTGNLSTLGGVHKPVLEQEKSNKTTTIAPLNHLSEKVARFMKTLNKRSDKVYAFYDGDKLVGRLHPKSKQIWLQEDSPFNTQWELKASDELIEALSSEVSIDATQWIWNKVISSPEYASSIIDTETPVALKSWFKPSNGEERRELVRLFTILRKREYTVSELAQAANMELKRVHSFVAALLISGSLYVAPDRMLNVNTHSEIGMPLEEKPKEKAPKKSKDKGFLSRFRKKFGL